MYQANEKRYETMKYHRCGNSGLMLPAVSLGLWHNFGSNGNYDNMLDMCFTAFDQGITHFDLANNYGPVPGAAEENFGRILKDGLGNYRDELVISTKAGYDMWKGPYGNWGSRKYLIASLDQSLQRMGLDYVDLGKQTGRMAAEVLKGEKKASELNFEVIEEAAFYGNSKVAEDLGITFPEDLASNAKELFTEITQ